jgi:hypothetical protein
MDMAGPPPALPPSTLTVPAAPTVLAAPTVPAAPTTPENVVLYFELLLKVQQPLKCVRTAQHKLKNEKQEDISIGPIDVCSDVTWEQFLFTIANILQSKPANLAIMTFK